MGVWELEKEPLQAAGCCILVSCPVVASGMRAIVGKG